MPLALRGRHILIQQRPHILNERQSVLVRPFRRGDDGHRDPNQRAVGGTLRHRVPEGGASPNRGSSLVTQDRLLLLGEAIRL